MKAQTRSLFDWDIIRPAIGDAFKKLDPRLMVKNPVMFVTMVGAALTAVGIFTATPDLRGFVAQLALSCGSPSSSRISPKPWPKAAVKPRPLVAKTRKETMARRLRNGREEKVPAPRSRKTTSLWRGGRCDSGGRRRD
jgi:K+-transporting ATPase ATPase B chain